MSWTTSLVILGPLTTTWTPPPACSVVVASCSTCGGGWQAQTCPGANTVHDNMNCWPPRTSGVYTPQQAFLGWGVYSPANVCPFGYSTACSQKGAGATGDFTFEFQPRESETAIGCCPTGYSCYRGRGDQTCLGMLTSTTVPTVTCESGTSANFEYLTIPFAVPLATDSAEIISTFRAFAPLYQLIDTVSTTLSSDSSSSASSRSTGSLTSASSSQAIPTTASDSSSHASPTDSTSVQGLSTGGKAGIGCGAGLGVIILGTAAFCLFRRSRRRKNGENSSEKNTGHQPMPSEMSAGFPSELEAPHHEAWLSTKAGV
ncbi:hypothetical protein GGR54DRAFT_62049 [Hypoxylon sp. NC1633]|nr:hypothetical protein GGR54DRAFT_62049 [Hypoxylon sp. NC1633]